MRQYSSPLKVDDHATDQRKVILRLTEKQRVDPISLQPERKSRIQPKVRAAAGNQNVLLIPQRGELPVVFRIRVEIRRAIAEEQIFRSNAGPEVRRRHPRAAANARAQTTDPGRT